jgi:predicted glutamine amidotransferase
MCEQFVARASEPFRLDDLWPFTERLERYGMAGFGWGAAWLTNAGGIQTYRDVRAFRDDPAASGVGAAATTSALIHVRRPSKLSTLQLADTQPFADPDERFAFATRRRLVRPGLAITLDSHGAPTGA